MNYRQNSPDIEGLKNGVIASSVEVHRQLGNNAVESYYREALLQELKGKQIQFNPNLIVPLVYKKMVLDVNLYNSIMVRDTILVDIIFTSNIFDKEHTNRLTTLLQMFRLSSGLIINFRCSDILFNGYKSVVCMPFI